MCRSAESKKKKKMYTCAEVTLCAIRHSPSEGEKFRAGDALRMQY